MTPEGSGGGHNIYPNNTLQAKTQFFAQNSAVLVAYIFCILESLQVATHCSEAQPTCYHDMTGDQQYPLLIIRTEWETKEI